MSDTKAKLGIGTFLEFETSPGASPLAFTRLAEALDIPELPHTREFVDATNQDSAGYTKEYIAGLIDAEEFTVECNYVADDPTQIAVWNMFSTADAGARTWRVRESTESPEVTWTFKALVAKVGPSFPVQDKKKFSVTLRRTGPTTRA